MLYIFRLLFGRKARSVEELPARRGKTTDHPTLRILEVGDAHRATYQAFGEKSTFSHMFLGTENAAPLKNDACKINDEKKSGANGLVIDNVHETEIFSDNLENSSLRVAKTVTTRKNNLEWTIPIFPSESNLKERKQRQVFEEKESKVCADSKNKHKVRLNRGPSSYENLTKINACKPLYKSRPDLIKGIITHSKDQIPSASYHSCTDISNLSKSNSENSLNSLGSLDTLLLENTGIQNTPRKKIRHLCQANHKKSPFYMNSKKKDSRSEIVEAVTTRLYVPKKKTDTSKEVMQPAKIEECDEDNEFKGLKLCKRARMKLCALNRKLALAGSPKKTSDTITQTDFDQRTVRVKEKSVLTDQRGALEVESCGTCTCSAENLKERSKDPATFGQFTFPYNKSFVNCGTNDTLRTPQFSDKHNMQVSYAETMKGLANLPAEFVAKDEESFSEDSLDKEEPFQSDYINTNFYSEKHTNLKYMLPSNQDSTEPCDSLASLGYKKITTKDQNHSPVLEKNWNNIIHELDLKPKKKPQKEIQVKFFNGFASSLFPNTEDLSNLHDSIIRPLGLKKKDNLLSATKSAEAINSSETSSEDLLFYENATKIGPANGTNEDGERILYTITENNEQTNPKDALNSLQNQKLIYNLLTENRGLQSSLESLSLNKDDKIRFEKNLPNYHHKENAGILEQYEALLKAKYLYFKETQFEGNTRNIVVKEKTKNSYLMNDLNIDNIEPKTETHTAENSEPGNFVTKNPLDARVSSPTRLSACTNTKCTVEKVLDPCRTNNFMETSTKPIIRKPDSTEDNKSNITKAEFKCFEPKKINWADLPANNQKQFVNFNILNSPKKSQFSIDTHLFGEAMKKDQSTETMFGSKDSITFVFMGPAKPKTSVLMEVIKRSLNKGYSNEITFSHKKSRSTGVQCESKFLRSVSVDTAFIALSRIAQEPQQHISRTISLDNLTTDEMLLILEPEKPLSLKENSCQCDLDANCSKVPMKKLPLRYSVSTSTSQDQQTETVNLMSTSMNQTSLHHDGISIFETEENKVKALKNEIQQTLKDSFSSYINSSSQTRRVRFSKPETSKLAEDILQSINQKKESTHLNKSADAISIFLKEATILLRNLNYFNSFSHGSIESHEQRQDHLLRRKDLKAPLKKWSSQLKPPSFKEEADKRIPNFWANKSVVGRRKTETKNERVLQSLTWPRRQCAGRRAPERETEYGVNLKSLRSPKGPLSNSLNSNGSLDVTDKHSILGRQESNNTKLNTSNLSTARSNSCIQENQMRASSSRQNYSPEHELARDIFYYSSKPRHRIISVTDFSEIDSILDLETKLEESCYRLKLAAEQDQARQEVLEGKITEDVRDDHEQMSLHSLSSDYREGKCTTESRKSDSTMRLVKRRTSTECIRKCVCKDREKYFCTYPRSKNFRSTFELATFGPGSNHCNQFCTFCRRNESELYCSSPTLNSECSAGRCRLNYYGHCPCSSVKLRHVISSPRAYMQHLLTLRRHVINSRNISQT